MIALLLVAALQGEPNASLCFMAYGLELRKRQRHLGISTSVDPASLSSQQRNAILSLEPLDTEGRWWAAIAFSQDEIGAALKPAYVKLAGSVDEQSAAFQTCAKRKAADQRPLPQPPAPAPGSPSECVAEDAAIHRQIREHESADIIRARALQAQSGLEHGALTCGSLDQAQYIWMEIGSAAAAELAKNLGQ